MTSTLPSSTLPGTFGGVGLSQSRSRRLDYNASGVGALRRAFFLCPPITNTPPTEMILPALLQKLVGAFSFDFSWGNLVGILWEFFGPQKEKLKIFGGKYRSTFRKKIRSSKKIFRAKFALQTCHLKKYTGDGPSL